MNIKINPFNTKNPMSMKDAVIVSGLSATATYFLTFFVNATVGQVIIDPAAFVFDSVKIWMQNFWGTFITLAGLKELLKKKEE